MVDISKRLNEIAPGITPAELAKRCNFAWPSAKKYLGGGTPSVENAIAIADAFGVNIGWLLTGEGPMHRTPDTTTPLPTDETALLAAYRAVDDETKSAIQVLVRNLTKEVKSK